MQDIDCMPLNPVQNMPEGLRRQNAYASKFGVQDNDWRTGTSPRVPPTQSLECASGPSHTATYPNNTILKQVKVIFCFHLITCSISFILKVKA